VRIQFKILTVVFLIIAITIAGALALQRLFSVVPAR